MMEKLCLRSATEKDSRLLLDWRNEETVRKNSFNSDIISEEEHEAWFGRTLADKNERIYILMYDDVPVGQIRLSKKDVILISYSIAQEWRGQGLGRAIIQLAENEVAQHYDIKEMRAEVKKSNVASQMIFKNLGFAEAEADVFYSYGKTAQLYDIDSIYYSIKKYKKKGGGCS